jgi:DNA ligase-1
VSVVIWIPSYVVQLVFKTQINDMAMRYKPMLAYPVSNKPIDYSELVFIQPKLDGVRCLIQLELVHHGSDEYASGFGMAVKAYSRTGKEWKNIDHILKELKPFFKKHPDVVLDGELYNHDLRDNFEKIISCVRKTKPTKEHRAESKKLVQFHCYDVILEKSELSFDVRNEWIKLNVPRNFCIKYVETHKLPRLTPPRKTAEKYALDLHKMFLNKGYEGSMARLNYRYENKRSHNLRKIKDFQDAEATIIDWVEGKGKRKGTIGKFVGEDSEGIIFGMPVMDNFKYLQDNFEEMKTWVGREATFKYFERTKANSYRHPLFKAIRDYE